MGNHSLERFIRPRAVAVVGASQTTGSIGHTTIKNFARFPFDGDVYGVNPRYEQVEGFPCYPSLLAIPGPVDVVIIAVASSLVEQSIRECAAKQVAFVVILSSGFAEKGEEGQVKQNEILALCREHGIRVLGPNTMGTFNVKERILLTFAPPAQLLRGDVGIVSQSGATGGNVASLAMEEKIGLTYMLTTGNQMDLNMLDFLDYLVEDADTNVIAAYFEGIADGARLRALSQTALERHKPFVALKAGRSDAGQRAALSHTASLTGSSQIFAVAARQSGIVLVNEVEELIDAMKAFRSGKRPRGNRIATVVVSGATGIMLADKVTDYGYRMAELAEATMRQLAEKVPAYCSVLNPVDIASSFLADPPMYKHCIQTLADADEVDIVIAHLPIGAAMGGLRFAQDIVDVASGTDKPIIVAVTGTESSMNEVRTFLTERQIPAYHSIKSAAQAAHFLLDYEQMYSKRQQLTSQAAAAIPAEQQARHHVAGQTLTEPAVKRMLQTHRIPVPRGGLGTDWPELAAIAQGLRFPLVAKIVSPDIPHKSDAGGVILPINDLPALQRAWQQIRENVQKHAPAAAVDGILVEEMVQEDVLEAIIGVTRDPVFGPVVVCGLGGIYVEVLQDVVQRLAPVTEDEALDMIKQLKSYPLLTGARGKASYDLSAFARAVADLSQLAITLDGNWTDIEINPLVLFPENGGAMALDGLITCAPAKETVKQ